MTWPAYDARGADFCVLGFVDQEGVGMDMEEEGQERGAGSGQEGEGETQGGADSEDEDMQVGDGEGGEGQQAMSPQERQHAENLRQGTTDSRLHLMTMSAAPYGPLAICHSG
jgi:hypothetical protein